MYTASQLYQDNGAKNRRKRAQHANSSGGTVLDSVGRLYESHWFTWPQGKRSFVNRYGVKRNIYVSVTVRDVASVADCDPSMTRYAYIERH